MENGFEIKTLEIVGGYNQVRFKQSCPEDTANFYLVQIDNGKRPYAMYPTLGRKHVEFDGVNQLSFGVEPRFLFKTVKYMYVVEGNTIIRIDSNYDEFIIGEIGTLSGTPVYFDYLVVNKIVFACFVDEEGIYIYIEDSGMLQTVTDANAPGGANIGGQPGVIAAFGNRITVSVLNSSQFCLSKINLGGSTFDPATCFTNATTPSISMLEDGIIRQMGVLNNTLYIFCDYITGPWSNIAAVFAASTPPITAPWKKNATYNWNFGIANSTSLDIDFGRLVFLAQNKSGLIQFMVSEGGQPEPLNTKAISTLLQNYTNRLGNQNPFFVSNSNGFLYEYENTIFYRMSGGNYNDYGILDQTQTANSIEYNFESKEWHRCIELNGERNRVQAHVYFNNLHLVTVTGDSSVYSMSGQYYYNEVSNPGQIDPQAIDAYIAYPMRYERVTPIISEIDYSEFETEYVQIDFVFGDSNISFSEAPFQNAIYLIAEQALGGQPQYIIAEQNGPDGQPIFVLADNSNTPQLSDLTYNYLYNPSIELFFSDDGGISFQSADVRVFAQQGQYSWRMRWYQLGASRNRAYNLVCVSMVPIVVLGAVMNVRRISGGAN